MIRNKIRETVIDQTSFSDDVPGEVRDRNISQGTLIKHLEDYRESEIRAEITSLAKEGIVSFRNPMTDILTFNADFFTE